MPSDLTERLAAKPVMICPGHGDVRLYALCEDGSIWMSRREDVPLVHWKWVKLPAIPEAT